MRQIILDTETTGINLADGNRLVEVGCVEVINRKVTGNYFQRYVNPLRDSEEGALGVHGLTSEFLQDKPLFAEIADELIAFISGAEVIIHNAPFDVGFLNHELALIEGKKYGVLGDYCKITDTLAIARNKYPGQRNTLDALCKRLEVDNSHRQLHGALLDAEILADVYLLMTGGQTGLELGAGSDSAGYENAEPIQKAVLYPLPVLRATEAEIQEHEKYLQFLNDKSKGKCLWLKQGV